MVLLYVVQGQEKSDTVMQQLQEKAGRIGELSATLDSLRGEITRLTQQLEDEKTLKQELQADLNNVGLSIYMWQFCPVFLQTLTQTAELGRKMF